MNLLLEIISTPTHSVFERTMKFNQNGGKIGRNKNMDWVLHDPTKHISNFHAEIMFQNSQYFITDRSSNGIFFKNPHKKLTKDIAVPLTQTTIIIIGDYEISVKVVNNEFIGHQNMPSNNMGEDIGIPDQFFMGNETEKAFDVISQTDKNNDILSLIDSDTSISNSEILPELDNIIENYESPSMHSMDTSLNHHIEDPLFQQEEKIETSNSNTDDKLFKLLAVKLGIDTHAMSEQMKELLVLEIAELARITIEQSQTTLQSLKTIKTQLGIAHESSYNPLSNRVTAKEIFSNIQSNGQPLSHHIKNLFHDLNTHNVAFFTAYKNVSLQMAEKFSPQKLYYSFEQSNLLSKKLANKKALAWDAYYEKFKHLDIVKNAEDIDMSELQKEYQNTLKTLNLGYIK